MAKCQQCQRKTDLYLCTECQQDLHEMLQGLAVGQWVPTVQGRTKNGRPWHIEHRSPGLIEYLEDAQLGRTRLGESARRSNERTTPLPVRLGPERNPTAETQWRGSPSEILDNLHATLVNWVAAVNTNTETLAIEGETDE